jgi:hypothetical protein
MTNRDRIGAPLQMSAWKPITGPMKGKYLITNNITARDASGQMSHVWVGYIIENYSGPDWHGKFVSFDDADRKIHEITHYAEIPMPEAQP